MNDAIEDILRKKPHLTDPFRFYEKTVRFQDAVKALNVLVRPEQAAYAPEFVGAVFERFSTLLDLPEGSLSPLKSAMELGDIDFTRLPLGEVPAFSLPYAEDDLAMLLFLMSKPYFHALHDACRLDGSIWEEGACPVCNGQTALSWIGEDGRRQVCCSYCGTMGYAARAGCPVCREVDNAKQNSFTFDGEEGFRINACDLCHSYVKTVDAALISRLSPDIADLVSLPLDIVMQDKGYARRAPNPVGMRKITILG